jgi:hypothetical protein
VPYYSFLLHAHWPVSEHAIRLHYYDDLVLTLSIQKKKGLLEERYALELDRLKHPDADPETAASIAELQKRLDAVKNCILAEMSQKLNLLTNSDASLRLSKR